MCIFKRKQCLLTIENMYEQWLEEQSDKQYAIDDYILGLNADIVADEIAEDIFDWSYGEAFDDEGE